MTRITPMGKILAVKSAAKIFPIGVIRVIRGYDPVFAQRNPIVDAPREGSLKFR